MSRTCAEQHSFASARIQTDGKGQAVRKVSRSEEKFARPTYHNFLVGSFMYLAFLPSPLFTAALMACHHVVQKGCYHVVRKDCPAINLPGKWLQDEHKLNRRLAKPKVMSGGSGQTKRGRTRGFRLCSMTKQPLEASHCLGQMSRAVKAEAGRLCKERGPQCAARSARQEVEASRHPRRSHTTQSASRVSGSRSQ